MHFYISVVQVLDNLFIEKWQIYLKTSWNCFKCRTNKGTIKLWNEKKFKLWYLININIINVFGSKVANIVNLKIAEIHEMFHILMFYVI
jgi:hypothetical protein